MSSTPHVYAAIASVMARLAEAGISKERKNEQQGYKFRGIDDVYNALAPILSGAGLCILPFVKERTVTERATKSGGALFYVCVHVDFALVAAADGSSHTISVVGEAMDSADKATNKAMSAAYKYACLQAFCIPTEGDNDADSTTHDVRHESKTKLASDSDIEVIALLAEEAGVDMRSICEALQIDSINKLPLSKVAAVVGKLQSKIKTQ